MHRMIDGCLMECIGTNTECLPHPGWKLKYVSRVKENKQGVSGGFQSDFWALSDMPWTLAIEYIYIYIYIWFFFQISPQDAQKGPSSQGQGFLHTLDQPILSPLFCQVSWVFLWERLIPVSLFPSLPVMRPFLERCYKKPRAGVGSLVGW